MVVSGHYEANADMMPTLKVIDVQPTDQDTAAAAVAAVAATGAAAATQPPAAAAPLTEELSLGPVPHASLGTSTQLDDTAVAAGDGGDVFGETPDLARRLSNRIGSRGGRASLTGDGPSRKLVRQFSKAS